MLLRVIIINFQLKILNVFFLQFYLYKLWFISLIRYSSTCLSIIFLAVCVIGPKLSLNILVKKFYLPVFLCITVHTNWIIRINLKVLSFVIPTRLIGREAPDILFFYCFVLQWLQREDVHKSLVVYIVKQNQIQKLRILIIKKSWIFNI